ncbi:MAG: FecR domain-containing protein [Xanthobacteraceae bacterium]
MRARKGGAMKRREFIAWVTGGVAAFPALWPLASRGQGAAPANQPASAGADNAIGQVASMTGSATVTRGNAARAALKVADAVYAKDILQTDVNSSLGITFDDETTFSLSANTRIVIDSFVYQQGGHGNLASFNVAAGTASFIASLVAKTGDMKIATPEATLGIRGTTGIVEVPPAGGAAAPTIKLYPDADGHVGRIEVFNRQGTSLGALTQGASAFALRPGPGGRLAAVSYQIPAAEAARDRGTLQRLSLTHRIGRQMLIQRQRLRGPGRQGPNNQRPRGGQNPERAPQQPLNRPQRLPGQPRPRQRKNIFNEPKR